MARTYDNRARSAAALDTRRRILRTAYALIVDGGYASFTIAALADAAGVSPQTVYNSVGGKSQVLKAVYDVTMVGDDEPVPMSRRPEFIRLGLARTVAEWADGYAHYTARIYHRAGDLLGAVLYPGDGLDRGAGRFAATIEAERRIGTGHAIAALATVAGWEPASTAALVDAVWTLNSPDVFARLVQRSGWSLDRYTDWLARQLVASIESMVA